MTEEVKPHLEEVAEVPESEAPVHDDNVMDGLRRKRVELEQERSVTLDIPGYGGGLAARYQPVEWKVLKGIAEAVDVSRNPRAELIGQIDTLAKACMEIMVRVDGEYKSIDSDVPVRYDQRLAEYLGFEADRARQVVMGVFNNDLAITAHHNELAEWMQGTREEVDEDFLGEL